LDPILKIKGLNLIRDKTILRNLDWEIQSGENWVLLGPNGSGKTSLLSALTAYQSPTSGEICVFGARYGQSDWRELRKKIGLVSTSIGERIQPNEVARNIVLSGRSAMINYWGRVDPKDLDRAVEILGQIGCDHLQDQPWKYLSQGERQRALIGRALMADYRILILDEPCAGLDMVARESFLYFLGKLAASTGGPTLIFVTHHLEEILPCFSHVLLLRGGEVVAQGKKAEVLTEFHLERAFGAALQLKTQEGRYFVQLPIAGKKTNVFS